MWDEGRTVGAEGGRVVGCAVVMREVERIGR